MISALYLKEDKNIHKYRVNTSTNTWTLTLFGFFWSQVFSKTNTLHKKPRPKSHEYVTFLSNIHGCSIHLYYLIYIYILVVWNFYFVPNLARALGPKGHNFQDWAWPKTWFFWTCLQPQTVASFDGQTMQTLGTAMESYKLSNITFKNHHSFLFHIFIYRYNQQDLQV